MAGKSRHNSDDLLIEALARGECQTAAAKLAGCSPTTVRRRLDHQEFRRRIERFRAEMLEGAAGKLGATLEKAIHTLEDLLADCAPPAVRLQAARSIVEFTFRSREVLSWEKRLADLEANASSQKRSPNES